MTQPPPDPDSLPIDPDDCNDTPKLTPDEWAAIAELSPTDPDQEPRDDD